MSVLDLIFPKSCLDCKKEGTYLCSDCVAKVALAKPICPYCEKASIDGQTHTKCVQKYGLNGLVSIWEYDGVIKKAILAFKYKYSTEIGTELSRVFLRYARSSPFFIPDSGVLVPVPIFWYRENNRGFNQSAEIGKTISGALGWKFEPNLLFKSRPTTSQVELSGEARKENLRGVFTAFPHDSLFVIPDSIVLFDDVFTTGSTLREACKVLKRAGIEKVWGLTIAR